MKMVPVVAASGEPLTACHPARARELVRLGKALRRYSEAGFFIQMKGATAPDESLKALVTSKGGRDA
jgi:hypothetical protein